jgi:hypothetical protein
MLRDVVLLTSKRIWGEAYVVVVTSTGGHALRAIAARVCV